MKPAVDLDPEAVLEKARRILREEGEAILAKESGLGRPFVDLVRRLLAIEGKVCVTGVGKSGIVGEKIATTLSSTGTPAFFLRPVDALHGDLGVLRASDHLLAISNSGETAEVLAVVEAARGLGVPAAALTGNLKSSLAGAAEIAIDIGVCREACPLGLAPTASTAVTLAVGDALAMVLLELRGFTAKEYARFHPGGALGQRLRYRVADLMRRPPNIPILDEGQPLQRAIEEMTLRDNLGVTIVRGARGAREGALVGILTDGDLRRLLRRASTGELPLGRPVRELMTPNPKVIEPETPASEALRLMEVHGITSLPVVDPLSQPVGLLHLHDILGRGKILL
jgi:arabinose-5-phosphate isomerase